MIKGSGINKLIHLKAKTPWLIILIIVLAGVIWYFNYSLHFDGFFWNDSHDYNQIARNIYDGKGFSTSVLRPIHFLSFKMLPHPEVTRPPVYPYLVALSYSLFGVNDFSVVLLNGLFYVILVAATFLFSLEFSESKSTAFMTAASVALSGIFLRISLWGSSDIVYAALVTLFFYAFVKYPEKPFFYGLLLGVLYLTRMNTAFLIFSIALADYVFLKGRSWRRFALFTLGVIVASLPGFIRSLVLIDQSIPQVNTAVLFTRSFPGFSYWTMVNKVAALDFVRAHPEEFYEKLVQKFFYLISDFQNIFGTFFLILMAIGLIIPAKNELHRRLKRIVLFTALLQTLVIISVVNAEARYYIFLMPVVISFVFSSIKPFEEKYSKWLIHLFILLSIVLSSVSYWRSPKQMNPYRPLGQAIKGVTPENAVIVSDIAWEIAWYSNRKTVWLPYDIETMNKISQSIQVDYIFLSSNLSRPFAVYRDNIWQRLFFEVDSFNAYGFKLANVFYYGDAPIGVLYKLEKKSKNQEPS